jgi:hypothetical protein
MFFVRQRLNSGGMSWVTAGEAVIVAFTLFDELNAFLLLLASCYGREIRRCLLLQ